jgi:hypothetical protein
VHLLRRTLRNPQRQQKRSSMWSSPLELYPIHVSPDVFPAGHRPLIEPQTHTVNAEYLVVQPSREPYGIPVEYTRRLWIC